MLSVQIESEKLEDHLQVSSSQHHNVCPRQVLGVRMGMYAGHILSISLPDHEKMLYTFIESDGCFLDGVAAATGCTPGSRTMKVMDFGKMAATFVKQDTGEAIRIIPHPGARKASRHYVPEMTDRWNSYLIGYQRMPLDELFSYQNVQLSLSVEKLVSHSSARAVCAMCGEEVFNEREILLDNGTVLCCSCAGQHYYQI